MRKLFPYSNLILKVNGGNGSGIGMEAGGGWWAVGYETMMTRIYILILIYVWYVCVSAGVCLCV